MWNSKQFKTIKVLKPEERWDRVILQPWPGSLVHNWTVCYDGPTCNKPPTVNHHYHCPLSSSIHHCPLSSIIVHPSHQCWSHKNLSISLSHCFKHLDNVLGGVLNFYCSFRPSLPPLPRQRKTNIIMSLFSSYLAGMSPLYLLICWCIVRIYNLVTRVF